MDSTVCGVLLLFSCIVCISELRYALFILNLSLLDAEALHVYAELDKANIGGNSRDPVYW